MSHVGPPVCPKKRGQKSNKEFKQIPAMHFSVDYEKAFDKIKQNALLNAIKIQGVANYYIKSLAGAKKRKRTTDVTTFANPIRIPI